MTNGTELQRGTWRLEREDGREVQVEDHSGRDGHGTISPRPREPKP